MNNCNARTLRIRLHWVQVPLHEPFRISNGVVSVKDAILVELSTDRFTGWGEASPMSGSFYSGETPESTWRFLRDVVPRFLHEAARRRLEQVRASAAAKRCPAVGDPAVREEPSQVKAAVPHDGTLDPRETWQWLQQFPGEPFAKAGLEGAVWDLFARQRNEPLWQTLGGRDVPIVSGAAIGLLPTIDDLLARVGDFLRAGYRRIKIKIQPGADIELVRAVRERFGKIPLMVDANAAYSLADREFFEALDQFDLTMIEQPLAREALHEHAELQRVLRTPICLDESIDSPAAVSDAIRLRSGQIFNIKIQRMGGLSPALEAYEQARAAGIPCWVGTMPELGVASAHALHLGTLANFTYPTDVEASKRWYVDDVIQPPIEIDRNGAIALPVAAGMGYAVDMERVQKYRLAIEEFSA